MSFTLLTRENTATIEQCLSLELQITKAVHESLSAVSVACKGHLNGPASTRFLTVPPTLALWLFTKKHGDGQRFASW
jgi:hypothetical protein